MSGNITYEDKVVPYGRITFLPINGGRHSSGKIKSDGSYVASTFKLGDGVKPGEYKVTIKASKTTFDENERPVSQEWLVPWEYSMESRSPLRVIIESGASEDAYNFDIADE